MKSLVSFAESEFSGTQIKPVTSSAPAAPQCSINLELAGGRTYICFWEFQYRAAAAQAHFEELGTTLHDCLGDQAEDKADHPVNHPDFYELKTYSSKGIKFSASIKDKAALEKTFVFLRVENQ